MRPRPSHAGQSSRNLLTAWIGNTLSPIFSETGKRCQEITDKNKTKTRFSVYMLWSPQNLGSGVSDLRTALLWRARLERRSSDLSENFSFLTRKGTECCILPGSPSANDLPHSGSDLGPSLSLKKGLCESHLLQGPLCSARCMVSCNEATSPGFKSCQGH